MFIKIAASHTLTHFILGTYANSADPVQMPQNVASELGLHCLLTGISMQNTVKVKIFTTILQIINPNNKSAGQNDLSKGQDSSPVSTLPSTLSAPCPSQKTLT